MEDDEVLLLYEYGLKLLLALSSRQYGQGVFSFSGKHAINLPCTGPFCSKKVARITKEEHHTILKASDKHDMKEVRCHQGDT